MAYDFYDLRVTGHRVDLLLIEVARKIQLSPTHHETCTRNYFALCRYVDGPGSELSGLVLNFYPSGSFAIGAPILGSLRKQSHDVDIVVELDISPDTDPQTTIDTLYRSVKRGKGSQYYHMTTKNSRCVTVTYEDGHSIDLMPVARLPINVERVSNLFHYKPERGEKYHKEVNPKGFATYIRARADQSDTFAKLFDGYRIVAKNAETEAFLPYEGLDQKSPRIVEYQLIKRHRDKAYQRASHENHKRPPSVINAALGSEVANMSDSITVETRNVAGHILDRFETAHGRGELLRVTNPTWPKDVFTDRWPDSSEAQALYIEDLKELVRALDELLTDDLTAQSQKAILQLLFGETAATHAVNKLAEKMGEQRHRGLTTVGPTGLVSVLPSTATPLSKRQPYGAR